MSDFGTVTLDLGAGPKLTKFWNRLIIVLLLLFPVGTIAAQDTRERSVWLAPDPDSNRVVGVMVAGLKRTKPHVAEQPLRKFIGMNADSINTDDVIAAIMTLGILDPIEVFFADSNSTGESSGPFELPAPEGPAGPEKPGKILVAVVEEKWTFFPLPIVTVSSDTTNFGLAIMDSNAFGLNDKMILMGLYNLNGDWAATVMYLATPDRDHGIGWRIMGFYSDQNRVDVDQKESVIRQFSLASTGGGVGLDYSFTDFLTAGISVGVQDKILHDTVEPVEMPEQGMIGIGIVPTLSVRHTEWDGYFLSEQGASVNYTYQIGINGPSFNSVSFHGNFTKSLVPGFRCDIKTGVMYSPEAPVLFESSPSSARVDILPGKFSARNYAGGSAGFEKHLAKFGFGALSAAIAYQAVWSQGPILGHQFDHGLSGGIRLYLSKLAVPAMGLGAAYNVPARLLQGTFTVGMSF
jgi:hypothetical protein